MVEFSGNKLSCFRGGRLVFTNLSFSIECGGALILQGPNGSGKSSLLRIMAGLLQPIKGKVCWSDAGTSIEHDPDFHRTRTHYLGHADTVKPMMSVFENLTFWSRLRTPTPDVILALGTFGLKGLADVPGEYLSAGQKQRVNLARVVAAPANLWLLDEPTAGLDTDAIACLVKVIAAHREKGGLVITSSHQDLGLFDSQILQLNEFATQGPTYV